jgi:hypothetical protein
MPCGDDVVCKENNLSSVRFSVNVECIRGIRNVVT